MQVCGIYFAQLLHENARRPGIADDVVHGQKQHVVLRIELQDFRAQQRSLAEIESSTRFFGGNFSGFEFALRLAAEINDGHAEHERVGDHLHRLTIWSHGEGCSLGFVTADDFI